jgi:hypothetical protein
MTRVENITFNLPGFIMVAGQSNQGKTYFIYKGMIAKALEEGFHIHWVVNNGFDVEEPLAKQALKHKNIYIHPASDLSYRTMQNLIKIISSNSIKKLVIFDNFTYGITSEFLNLITYARKYNASTVFLTHTLFASKDISPRLRELISYYVFFYIPLQDSTSYKRILGEDLYETYSDEIESKSYKFLILDPSANEYVISKLPDYEIKFKVTDQTQQGKVADALRQITIDRFEQNLATLATNPVGAFGSTNGGNGIKAPRKGKLPARGTYGAQSAKR